MSSAKWRPFCLILNMLTMLTKRILRKLHWKNIHWYIFPKYIPTQKTKLSSTSNVGMRNFPAKTLWHHQMETFSVLLSPLCGNPPVTGGFPHTGTVRWIPHKWTVIRTFDVSLLSVWINWTNTRWAGNSRHHDRIRHCLNELVAMMDAWFNHATVWEGCRSHTSKKGQQWGSLMLLSHNPEKVLKKNSWIPDDFFIRYGGTSLLCHTDFTDFKQWQIVYTINRSARCGTHRYLPGENHLNGDPAY